MKDPVAGVPAVQTGGEGDLQGRWTSCSIDLHARDRSGHGLAVNPETGEIWETEQGPSGGDEINIIRAGRNYGWPLVNFGRDYFGNPISARPTKAGMEDPQVVWLPSIGLTGMTFYTGDRFPNWKRNIFVAGLREGGIPRSGQLQRVVCNEKWESFAASRCCRNLSSAFATCVRDLMVSLRVNG